MIAKLHLAALTLEDRASIERILKLRLGSTPISSMQERATMRALLTSEGFPPPMKGEKQ